MIDERVKKIFGSWISFANLQNQNPTNFKRKIMQNISRLNKWLEPAGMQIKIVLKKQKRVSQRSELLAFKKFISKTPQAELEYYSDEEFTDLYIKAK